VWRGIVGNRYVVVFGLIALVTGGWNLYVARHSQGLVEGRVVGPAGEPVPGATVTLLERTLTTLEARARTQTNEDGHFRFVGQKAHHLVLEASKDGRGPAARTTIRLYFRSQNRALVDPLRLGPAP
jgi:hypothetical protein